MLISSCEPGLSGTSLLSVYILFIALSPQWPHFHAVISSCFVHRFRQIQSFIKNKYCRLRMHDVVALIRKAKLRICLASETTEILDVRLCSYKNKLNCLMLVVRKLLLCILQFCCLGCCSDGFLG